jgi:alkanesulfonate monooxygenase
VEYITIIQKLLESSEPISFSGKYYQVSKLKLHPQISRELLPEIFISGSSEAGLAAARTIGARAIQYPKPVEETDTDMATGDLSTGVRVGIVCREQSADAWNVAEERFPEDRKGQLTRQLANKVSDSTWHAQLSAITNYNERKSPYWLIPFQNYKTMCPYLVGDYKEVAHELKRYVSLGHETFILDVPSDQDDLLHTRKAFDLVGAQI